MGERNAAATASGGNSCTAAALLTAPEACWWPSYTHTCCTATTTPAHAPGWLALPTLCMRAPLVDVLAGAHMPSLAAASHVAAASPETLFNLTSRPAHPQVVVRWGWGMFA